MSKATYLNALIVGAGFGGLYALIKLREAGYSVKAIEAAPEVGGTWYWNRYPGARSDVPSVYYAYSFSRELRDEWKWSEMHAGQPEILRYANFVADKFDLRRDIHFETRVISAIFDETLALWVVSTNRAEIFHARFLVMATGNLSVPHKPKFEGLADFKGDIHYTATWTDREVSFKGKKVGVIGTGSTGIQIIPLLAKDAEKLVVFQRTANFSLPMRNQPLDETLHAKMDAALPRHIASLDAGRVIDNAPPLPSREEQLQTYEMLWQRGGTALLGKAYPQIYTDSEANRIASHFIHDKISGIVKDAKTAEMLTPKDHPFGVKRPCLDTDYYVTFNKQNVTLVNLRDEPIVTLTATGVKTASHDYPLDMLVIATGFDAMTGALMAVDIKGRGGVSIQEAWSDGAKAYLGIAAAGFPNLFMLTGPGSLSVIGNVILNNEHHVDWMVECMAYAKARGATQIEASFEAQEN